MSDAPREDPPAEPDSPPPEVAAEATSAEPPEAVVFDVRCPACGAETTAELSQAGKRGRCGDCGGSFLILPPPGLGPIPIARESDVPVVPFDGPPHRASTILGLGVAAMVTVTITTAVTACCPYVPIDVVGIVLGIVATVMARRDLAAMNRGAMDPAGRQKTTLGFGLALCAAVTGIFLFGIRLLVLAMMLATMVLIPAMKPAPPGGPLPPVPTTAPPIQASPQSSPPSSDAPVVPLEIRDLDS